MYKILIVEDDSVIASVMQKQLTSWGCEVLCAGDFQRVMETFLEFEPQLVLLDISLPFFNGYHWCGEIRKLSSVPVIFISSASDNMNIVMAMNMGGDDFIAKPFDLDVFTAKVQAMLRRTYDFTAGPELLAHRGAVLNVGDTSLSNDGRTVELGKNDFKILQILLENKGRVVSRDTLMNRLWATDCFVDENTLTVNMTRLRQKLKSIGLEHFITTKKGLGYLVD